MPSTQSLVSHIVSITVDMFHTSPSSPSPPPSFHTAPYPSPPNPPVHHIAFESGCAPSYLPPPLPQEQDQYHSPTRIYTNASGSQTVSRLARVLILGRSVVSLYWGIGRGGQGLFMRGSGVGRRKWLWMIL